MFMMCQVRRRRRHDRRWQHPSIRVGDRQVVPVEGDSLGIQHALHALVRYLEVAVEHHLRTIRRQARSTRPVEPELAPGEQGRGGLAIRSRDVVGNRVGDVVAGRGEAAAAEEEHVLVAVLAQVWRLDQRAVAVVAVEDLDGFVEGRHAVRCQFLQHDGSRLDRGNHVRAETAVSGVVAVDFVDDVLLVSVWITEAGEIDGTTLLQMAGDRGGLRRVRTFDAVRGRGSDALGVLVGSFLADSSSIIHHEAAVGLRKVC